MFFSYNLSMYICIKLLNRPYYDLYNVFFTNFTDVLNYMLMKIRHLKVSALLLAATLLTSSCVGSFSLFNRVAKWNTHATSSKFLNEIIFILISPAYAVCAVADALVLNTIEFWSGSNPLAQKVGTVQKVTGKDGLIYAVKTLRNGYEVTSPNGEVVSFIYDKKTNSWSQEQNGKKVEIFRFNDDGTIQARLSDGETIRVNPDEAGVFETRMAVNGARFWACR